MCDIQLYNGDCLEVMDDLIQKGIKVDAIITDPPYGTTASKWDKCLPMDKVWEKYDKILNPTGNVIIFSNGIFTPRVMISKLDYYKYRWVWIKKNSTNFVHAKNRPMTKSEDILVFSKGGMGHISQLGEKRMTYNPQGITPVHKIRKNGKANFTNTLAGKRPSHKDEFIVEYTNYPTDILDNFPEVSPTHKLHPNEKPINLLEYLVKTYTNEGDIVMDNCMGSGTTGVACRNTNRNFIGIEKDKNYFEIAKNRIENC